MIPYFFTTAAMAVGLSLVAYVWYGVTRSRFAGQAATMLAGIAAVALVLHLGMRWAVAGHAPWSNQFVYAALLPDSVKLAGPLIPALQNNLLLTIHVSAAVMAYGVFAISFAGAVLYFVQGGSRNRVAWLPTAEVAEDLAHKAVMVAVPLQALVLTLGAWWASIAWSRPWGWDPKETAALTTLLVYVVYLHARNQRGWRGTPSTLILIAGFGATLFTFFGNYFLGGLHTYSGL